MNFDVACALMKKFRQMGAQKISLLGGEPTIYGRYSNNWKLSDIILEAHKLEYQYIRVVTNGLFEDNLLTNENFKLVNEITFSFDGKSKETHEAIRGKGTFSKTKNNLLRSISLGYKVDITVTIHKGNITSKATPWFSVDEIIRWAISMGVSRINFHPIFEMGIDRDKWVENTYIQQSEWEDIYKVIRRKIDNGDYSIPVRLPQRFVSQTEFYSDPDYYGYCPVKMGERVEVHPNGLIQVCALLKGTPTSIAKYQFSDGKLYIHWTRKGNEVAEYPFMFDQSHPCAVIRKKDDGTLPLCISFKPKQNEIVWEKIGMK